MQNVARGQGHHTCARVFVLGVISGSKIFARYTRARARAAPMAYAPDRYVSTIYP